MLHSSNPLPQSIHKKQNLQDSTQKAQNSFQGNRLARFLSAGVRGQATGCDHAPTATATLYLLPDFAISQWLRAHNHCPCSHYGLIKKQTTTTKNT